MQLFAFYSIEKGKFGRGLLFSTKSDWKLTGYGEVIWAGGPTLTKSVTA